MITIIFIIVGMTVQLEYDYDYLVLTTKTADYTVRASINYTSSWKDKVYITLQSRHGEIHIVTDSWIANCLLEHRVTKDTLRLLYYYYTTSKYKIEDRDLERYELYARDRLCHPAHYKCALFLNAYDFAIKSGVFTFKFKYKTNGIINLIDNLEIVLGHITNLVCRATNNKPIGCMPDCVYYLCTESNHAIYNVIALRKYKPVDDTDNNIRSIFIIHPHPYIHSWKELYESINLMPLDLFDSSLRGFFINKVNTRIIGLDDGSNALIIDTLSPNVHNSYLENLSIDVQEDTALDGDMALIKRILQNR